MAESKPIKSNELIDDDVFTKATANAAALEGEIAKLTVGLEGVIKANATLLKQNKDPKDSSQIKEQIRLLGEQEKARKAYYAAEQASERLKQASLKTQRDEIALLKQQQSEAAKQAKAAQQLNSEYSIGVKRLSELKKALKDLTFTGKENTDQFKLLNNEYVALDAKIRVAEQSVGEFQRNVGNYKSGFDGLGNSINQLTREMPAFAMSAQTGFMALSNNIPIFFDQISKTQQEIKALRAQENRFRIIFTLNIFYIFLGNGIIIGCYAAYYFRKRDSISCRWTI